MSRLFVTGTGTGVGKTFVSAAITYGAVRGGVSARAFKPLASGFTPDDPATTDPGILLTAMGLPINEETLNSISPWRYVKPVAPYLAAEGEGRQVPYGAVVDFSREALRGPEELILVEGVGGVMAPVDRVHTVLDWIGALTIPAILVAGTYVGTISHTLAALGVLRAAGIRVFAIILNETLGSAATPEEQADAIAQFAGGVPIHVLQHLDGEHAWSRSQCANLYESILRRLITP